MAKYFLKFGERDHIEEFAAGKLYFSNAERFWGIEKDLQIKGQGDILEAGFRVPAIKATMQPLGTDESIDFGQDINVLVHLEPAKSIPVFCLFSVYDEDCSLDANGKERIRLDESKQDTIRTHFPKADTVGIVKCPNRFLEDIEGSIGTRVEHEEVHYYQIDKGVLLNGNSTAAIDGRFLQYLVGKSNSAKIEGATQYSVTVEQAYRALFCKDIFFKDEQEYRIVLPDQKITQGTLYRISMTSPIEVIPLDDLFLNETALINFAGDEE